MSNHWLAFHQKEIGNDDYAKGAKRRNIPLRPLRRWYYDGWYNWQNIPIGRI